MDASRGNAVHQEAFTDGRLDVVRPNERQSASVTDPPESRLGVSAWKFDPVSTIRASVWGPVRRPRRPHSSTWVGSSVRMPKGASRSSTVDHLGIVTPARESPAMLTKTFVADPEPVSATNVLVNFGVGGRGRRSSVDLRQSATTRSATPATAGSRRKHVGQTSHRSGRIEDNQPLPDESTVETLTHRRSIVDGDNGW